jgi:hypothetical protein
MRSRVCKSSLARVGALALALGGFGSLATAPASFAAGAGPKPPAVGTACQPDGKINGGGSTFQTNAINNAFTWGYQEDVCGPQPNVANLNATWGTTDPSQYTFTVGSTTNTVQGMVAYNASLGGVSPTNGSGNGLARLSCRIDMFDGTDLPYNNAQLGTPGSATTVGLDGPPGSESLETGTSPYNCDNNTQNTTAVPPAFGPQPSAGPWPVAADTATNVMSFPIAGGAVAYGINLNGACTAAAGSLSATLSTAAAITSLPVNALANAIPAGSGVLLNNGAGTTQLFDVTTAAAAGATSIAVASQTPNFAYTSGTTFTVAPTGINLTQAEFQDIYEGTINQWNDATLVATDPVLTTFGCSGPITRVVRKDNSGTTAITEFTLAKINGGTLCGTDASNNWYALATASSNAGTQPEALTGSSPNCVDANGNAATNFVQPANTGTPAVISTTESTNGSIGYGELGLWGTPPAGVSFASIQNAGGTAFVAPGAAGAKSNCTLPASPPTGSTNTAAVGLGSTTWSNTGTAAAPGAQDVADSGTGYPACGITFDLVYTGQSEANEVAGASGTAGCTGSTVITGACQTVTGPLAGVTNDQLRTMYSYFTYMFSPLAQNTAGSASGYLNVQTLDPLPGAWLPLLVSGFQNNF